MEPQAQIEKFLRRVRDGQKNALNAQTGLYLLAYLSGSVLFGFLISYNFPQAAQYPLVFIILFSAGLGGLAFWLLKQGHFSKLSLDQAALLTEKKYPHLNNALINSCQLGRRLAKNVEPQSGTSLPLIEELLRRTQPLVEAIRPRAAIDTTGTAQSRRWFFALMGSLMLATLLIPDFLPRGYGNWVHPQAAWQDDELASLEERAAASKNPALSYSIQNLSLKLNFPAYTSMESEVVNPSDGNIEVLPGTEVKIEAQTNHPITGAELVLNGKDHFVANLSGEKKFHTGFLAEVRGFYQFALKDPAGTKFLMPKRYPIKLARDDSPTILLFPANPKPVYHDTDKVHLYYEGRDDYGITAIDLVAYIGNKKTARSIKRIKGQESESKGSYAWDLSSLALDPGEEVQYFLSITDNDNVLGPNTGESETISFTIFDFRKERENLIALQEELIEKMIALLAEGLVQGASLGSGPSDPLRWKGLLTTSADSLIDIIGLAQRIQDRAESLDNFPRTYQNLLKNLIAGFAKIREGQIEAIHKIQNRVLKPTPVSLGGFEGENLNDDMVDHLEKNILFLIKITNRQKMDQVMDLERHLTELTESLREEFDKIKDKKSPLKPDQIQSMIDQIKKTLRQIMDKLSRQNQSMPDEFLNPNAFKSMNLQNFTASLDRIMDLIQQGKMEEALEELKKTTDDLRTLGNQLNQASTEMDELLDMKIMEQLDDSLDTIQELEKKQKDALERTSKINQDFRRAQAKNSEDDLERFFVGLRKDVLAIQSVLKGSGQFIDGHPAMQRFNDLMNEETELKRKIRELGQKTVDSSLDSKLGENFKQLNSARRRLSRLTQEMDSLRVRIFQEFKDDLPQLKERYEALKELTELFELNEFNMMFKRTYPEIFHWRNNLRGAYNSKEDLADRTRADLKEVSRLNSEISKKLGTMLRRLQETGKSLLTEQNKSNLNEIAEQENTIRQGTDRLQRRFQRMNEENPMLTPELANRMNRSSRHLERAENQLKSQMVQEGLNSENYALKELQQTRELLEEIQEAAGKMSRNSSHQSSRKLGTGRSRDSRRGGSVRMQKEKVQLPTEDQYKAPAEFREELLEAMKKRRPKPYERLVMEYYRELIR